MIPSNGRAAMSLAEVRIGSGARADMHCHSTASEAAKLGIQRSLGLPECATPPEEVYELAKRRGMDFVTITDHDTIDGCLEIADRPDVFVSEELTAWFAGEPQAVHVLCYGIDPADHERLQAHAADVEECAAYLHEREITCALAHPFFAVAAPLARATGGASPSCFRCGRSATARARRSSTCRRRSTSRPAAVPASAGLTTTPASTSGARGQRRRPRRRRKSFCATCATATRRPRATQGSAAKWAHAALALATRALLREALDGRTPRAARPRRGPAPGRAGGERGRRARRDARRRPRSEDARRLLRAWLEASAWPSRRAGALIELMQADDFSHAEFYRRARRRHERELDAAREEGRRGAATARDGYPEAARGLFEACIPVVPYVPATAFLGSGAGEARGAATASPPSGARGRRRRLDARGGSHDRADPGERGSRLRGGRDRNRPAGRPAPAGRRRGRRALLCRPAGRSAQRPRAGRDAEQPGATTSSTSHRPARRGWVPWRSPASRARR